MDDPGTPDSLPIPSSPALPDGTARRLQSWRNDYWAAINSGCDTSGLEDRSCALLDELEALVEVLSTGAGTTPTVDTAAADTDDVRAQLVEGPQPPPVNVWLQMASLDGDEATFTQRSGNPEEDATVIVHMAEDVWLNYGRPLDLRVTTPGVL